MMPVMRRRSRRLSGAQYVILIRQEYFNDTNGVHGRCAGCQFCAQYLDVTLAESLSYEPHFPLLPNDVLEMRVCPRYRYSSPET